MIRSAASPVEAWLAGLPEERRAVIADVRTLIQKHLPKGYEESVSGGMLCYQVPLASYPETYNGQPLGYVALDSHKNYCALYLMAAYMNPAQTKALQEAFANRERSRIWRNRAYASGRSTTFRWMRSGK
jgi:hypothetical protein